MEKALQTLEEYVLFYLNRTFKVEEGKVYGDDNIVKWCGSVTEELTSIFGFDNILLGNE